MGLLFNKNLNTLFIGASEVSMIYMGSTQIWPVGLPVGTTFDFEYTGTVQEVTLPKGKYKLQCWGAQGGTSYGSPNGAGSKGGYSEGILTLTETKTLYVFVGGQGSRGSSTSLVNGGWNGGGASTGFSSYTSGDEYGHSYPACGGGATDICTISSDMTYSSGRTNRSSESLLSRCIVAGGGAGGSYRYTEYTTTYDGYWITYSSDTGVSSSVQSMGVIAVLNWSLSAGTTYKLIIDTPDAYNKSAFYYIKNGQYKTVQAWSAYGWSEVTFTAVSCDCYEFHCTYPSAGMEVSVTIMEYIEPTSSTSSSSNYSNGSQQGGGTSGKGQYPGTQTSAGSGGGFGYGANQTTTNYMYCSGGGGGGWYGGGTGQADGSTGYVNYSGGGSGFVNTSANASSRPSGYTGLQLDSGTTTAGNTSHPSKNGGMETGHSGNGFARIIAVDENGNYPIPEPTYSINWEVRYGTWNDSSSSSAADGVSYTCISPEHSGSTVIRCTFSGITSITFNCSSSGESCCDYLTVGNLDASCTRSSYKTKVSNTTNDLTYICDTGEHYVEFCYSKDGSVVNGSDNATVYIKAYS